MHLPGGGQAAVPPRPLPALPCPPALRPHAHLSVFLQALPTGGEALPDIQVSILAFFHPFLHSVFQVYSILSRYRLKYVRRGPLRLASFVGKFTATVKCAGGRGGGWGQQLTNHQSFSSPLMPQPPPASAGAWGGGRLQLTM